MPVSRGSIHHKISADIWALITSFIRPRFYLSPPKSSFRSHAHDCIESYFSSGQNATLFPFARTAFYAVLASLSLPSGTTVLLTPFNIYPMKDIILSMGLNPVVVDINLTDYGPVEQDLVTHLSKKPGCFLLTYLFGYVPNVERIVQLCDFYGVPLIEDISQAIGSTFNGYPLGTFGIASIYSSSLTKYVDAYNGAFALTSNNELHAYLNKFTRTDLHQPNPGRVKKVILKTTIWNICLKNPFFSVFVFPLLKLLKSFSPVLFESLLGPSIKKVTSNNLPSYYFEDITYLQSKMIVHYLGRLKILLNSRVEMSDKACQAYFNVTGHNIHHPTSFNKRQNCWQLLVPVVDVDSTRKLLFSNGIETGTTNLPNLSSFPGIECKTANLLKTTRIFLPLHAKLSVAHYEAIFDLLHCNNLLLFGSSS